MRYRFEAGARSPQGICHLMEYVNTAEEYPQNPKTGYFTLCHVPLGGAPGESLLPKGWRLCLPAAGEARVCKKCQREAELLDWLHGLADCFEGEEEEAANTRRAHKL